MPSSVAPVLGTVGLGLLSGCVLSFTFFLVPVMLAAPSEIQPVLFKRAYAIGKVSMPTLAVATAAALGFSYATSPDPQSHYLYSAGLALAIAPFTVIFMMSTVNACHEYRPDLATCLKRWGYLNLVRGLFPLAGFVLNLIATA
ncbi:hypothetical protein V1525DRAFT_393640 [Lipomyces kononenkoae]|uniref:Uncharacterized protein n=1 Tax=Lipomyces kononenkoae TaxID=34357 RepID=A0ACC3TBF7_LIPKO